jgi:hypothetical protein
VFFSNTQAAEQMNFLVKTHANSIRAMTFNNALVFLNLYFVGFNSRQDILTAYIEVLNASDMSTNIAPVSATINSSGNICSAKRAFVYVD